MSGGFHTLPFKVATVDGQHFALLEDIVFERPNGEKITIKANEQSDGASAPRPLWNLFPPFGKYWPAAYLHDVLYRYSQLPKDVCDTIFKEAMQALGVDEETVFSLYESVHFGGQAAFDEDRAKQ